MNNYNTWLFRTALITLIVALGAPALGATMSPSLESALCDSESQGVDSIISVIVFTEDSDKGAEASFVGSLRNISFKARHQRVIESLKYGSNDILTSVKNEIVRINPESEIKQYWIAPALSFEIPLSRIDEIAGLPGVVSVIQNARLEYIEPVESSPSMSSSSAVSSHLEAMNIPALWRRGLRGSGRLVCSFDTGVEGIHPALKDKWRGHDGDVVAAWFSPVNASATPSDLVGHGTHTMGIMVGSTPIDSFGVAPDAEWMTAAVVDQGQTLSKTISDILSAFEWAVDPDGDPSTSDDVPDVILNSWGVPQAIFPPCDETFNLVIENVEAAGIITIFAAGNEGPDPSSLRIPADNAISSINAFSVGAIDVASLLVAEFSSRGPSACNNNEMKPEVVAPGVSINSSFKGGVYKTMSGTSMAAPFIAGLAALLRQYNPEATVAEVKNAIIQSAQDLGPAGEDNAYGHGLPDAELAISFMPRPANPPVFFDGYIVDGDAIADPGETFNLFIRISVPAGQMDSLSGNLISDASGVEIINPSASFIFPLELTTAMNVYPFVVNFSHNLIHGDEIPFRLALDLPFGVEYDTVDVQIMVGSAPDGNMLTHNTSRMQVTVSDFGQLGLGYNSIYSAGGDGFKYDGSENLLYEAGIIVGRNALQLSSSVRDSLGRADHSDFKAAAELTSGFSTMDDAFQSDAVYVDNESDIPIPIAIRQITANYDDPGDDGFVILRYFIINQSAGWVTDLNFGFMSDFDLGETGEQLCIHPDNGMLYQSGELYMVGILPLSECAGRISLENVDGKLTMTGQDKYDYICQMGNNVNEISFADYLTIINFGAFNIAPGDSVEIALALAVGSDFGDLYNSAVRAASRYHGVTAFEDYINSIPENFVLHQNYPNPFNPSTTIAFDLTSTQHVKLDVLNILGQKVATLFDGTAHLGNHEIAWDGTDDHGRPVASGMYFYNLKTEGASQSKKMLMMK